ncbi:MAG: transposase [Thermoleophilia bacterium]|nr:transposase [Thermoleophilia bacterium]
MARSRRRIGPRRVRARAATIRDLGPELEAILTHRISNGRVESVNAKIRLIQTRASGFHHTYALIALAKLTLSGLCRPLPCRPAT